jgi:hypothetical protein
MRETLSDLSDAELDAVARFVRGLAARNREILDSARAYEHGSDPYMYVDDDDGGRVELAVPPGEPRHWFGSVIRSDEDPRWAHVEVDMYDMQDGEVVENDLTLEVELVSDVEGPVTITMRNLHVM